MTDYRHPNWPQEPADPIEALRHTIDVYADSHDTQMIIIATSNVYAPGIRTGLTWGDLRAIANILKEQQS